MSRRTATPGHPGATRAGAAIAVLAVMVVLPVLVSTSNTRLFTIVGELSLAALGLVLLHGFAGQLSLGQSGFMAVGAYSSAIMIARYGWPALGGMAFGLVLSCTVAVVMGLPLLRLRGLYLALATLAFVTIVENVAVGARELTGGPTGQIVGDLTIAGVSFESVTAQFYLVWCVVGVAMWASWNFARSAKGRAVRAIGRDDLAAGTMGVPVTRYKLGTFVAAAALASAGGSLYAHTLNFISAESIGPALSLRLIVMHFLGGAASLGGAVAGVGILEGIPRIAPITQEFELVLSGVLLILVLRFFPGGLVPGAVAWFRRRAAPAERSLPAERSAPAPGPVTVNASKAPRPERAEPPRPLLKAEGITKSFDGLQVLVDVSCTVAAGSVTSIIGPNGAGKTTLLNILTGVVLPDRGAVWLGDDEITGASPHTIARLGVARTFQTPRLHHAGTALENVMMGAFVHAEASLVATLLRSPSQRREEATLERRSRECLAVVGMAELADRQAGSLPLGFQRRLEVARALAHGPRLLVLDEPAAGSNDAEREFLAELLATIRSVGGTVLLVEHNMDLVMSVSDQVVVIDHGVPIGCGTPEQVRQTTRVIEAYLGQAG